MSFARQLPSLPEACTQGSGDRAPGPGTALAHPALPREPRGQGFGWASAIRPRLHPRACLLQLAVTLPPLRDLGVLVAPLPATLPRRQQLLQFKVS